MYLFIVVFGILVTALVEATVAKAAYCVDNFKKGGQRNCVLPLLKTEEVKRYIQKYKQKSSIPL